ncbi:MAG: ParB/RepB/Spo0J family partition protein [Phycisphaeraceae bacterium]
MNPTLESTEQQDTPWTQQLPKRQTLKVDQISADRSLQCREYASPEHLEEYADDMKRGCQFPPVTVFHDGGTYRLADGFHRVQSAISAGHTEIDADIHEGDARDVMLFAASTNSSHGLRRSNEDKRRAIKILLVDLNMADRSDRHLAKLADVDHKTVASVRQELACSGEMVSPDERIGSDGRKFTVESEDEGRSAKAQKQEKQQANIGPDYPEGLAAELDSFESLVAAVNDLATVDDSLLGYGHDQESVAKLTESLEDLLARMRSVARAAKVPKIERQWLRTRHLHRYLEDHHNRWPYEIKGLAYRGDDGLWHADVMIKGKEHKLWNRDSSNQWN